MTASPSAGVRRACASTRGDLVERRLCEKGATRFTVRSGVLVDFDEDTFWQRDVDALGRPLETFGGRFDDRPDPSVVLRIVAQRVDGALCGNLAAVVQNGFGPRLDGFTSV